MLVLFETPAGYSLFKVANEKKFKKVDADEMHDKIFSSADKTKDMLNLLSFQPFQDTADAVAAATACIEGTVSKSLKSFLKRTMKQYPSLAADKESLAVADKALGQSIKETLPKFPCSIAHDNKTNELFRGIRMHAEDLMSNEVADTPTPTAADMRSMQLGLSHSLSRYKLKFSADKVDTMVIQAIGLIDELDKEINFYAMRVKEWYGWHFPEMQKVLGDNVQYAKVVLECGLRTNIKTTDLSSIIEDQTVEAALKETAELSMGTDITDLDMINITSLAEQVLSLTEYRAQLYEYLRNRMNAIAPNLCILLGELVGARLISHAGSLMNLAKQPASTVQILGAEKALFRALKTKHDTPKYGLIYHASLIGQAQAKNKGKISRLLAAKAALAIRVDALSDETTPDTTIGYESRSKIEARLNVLEGGVSSMKKGSTLSAEKTSKYVPSEATATAKDTFNATNDINLTEDTPSSSKKADKSDKKSKKKRKRESTETTKSDNGDDDAGENGDDSPSSKEAKKAAKKAKKEKKKEKKSRKSDS